MVDQFEVAVIAAMPRLRAYARKLTRCNDAAADLVQDTVAKSLEKRHMFATGTNQLAWMMRILHNTHSSALRRERMISTVEIGEHHALSSDDPSSSQLIRELRTGLRALAPGVVRLIIMRAQGETYESMARAEGLPAGTVRSRLSRGKLRLRVYCDR